jgi:hypothetical protein
MQRYVSVALVLASTIGVAACGTNLTETSATAETSSRVTPAASPTAARTHARTKQAAKKSAAAESGCMRKSGAVIVSLTSYPHIADHVRDAIRDGQPAILHIDRPHADQHRGRSTDDLPTKRAYDRDEYPPAMSREGGESADVRYVKSSENRAAGASMGSRLRDYCNGQAFRLKVAKPSGAAARPTGTANATSRVPHEREIRRSPDVRGRWA